MGEGQTEQMLPDLKKQFGEEGGEDQTEEEEGQGGGTDLGKDFIHTQPKKV